MNAQQATESKPSLAVRTVVVNWINEKKMTAAAIAKGYAEGGGDSLMDFVDPESFEETRIFPSLTKAKAWARRNKALDLWNDPDITVYEWPDARKRHHERELVLHLQYIGDGQGWEEVEQ